MKFCSRTSTYSSHSSPSLPANASNFGMAPLPHHHSRDETKQLTWSSSPIVMINKTFFLIECEGRLGLQPKCQWPAAPRAASYRKSDRCAPWCLPRRTAVTAGCSIFSPENSDVKEKTAAWLGDCRSTRMPAGTLSAWLLDATLDNPRAMSAFCTMGIPRSCLIHLFQMSHLHRRQPRLHNVSLCCRLNYCLVDPMPQMVFMAVPHCTI